MEDRPDLLVTPSEKNLDSYLTCTPSTFWALSLEHLDSQKVISLLRSMFPSSFSFIPYV